MAMDEVYFKDADLKNLKNDANEMEKASALVQIDINKTQKEIEDNETKIKNTYEEIQELQVKIALYQGRSKTLRENNRISDELSNRIEARSRKWKKTSSANREKTYFSKNSSRNAADGNNGNVDLEPACNRKVRLACKQIMGLKKRQLLEDVNERSSRDADYDVSRDHLWTMLEEVLADFEAKEIVNSLCQNTIQSSNSLASKTKKIDLVKDAGELRFKFEAGKLKDVSEQPILLRSVDQLIEQGQSAHFQRFLDAEKAKNDAWRGRKRFEKAQQIVNNLLQKKYGIETKELNLNRRVLNLETELYGIDAATAYAKELIADLNNQRALKKQEEQQLTAKFAKIQDFEAKAQRNQLMIQALVKQNGTSKNRIEQQQNEVLQYLKDHICAVGSQIDVLVSSIKESVTKELNQFSSLKLSRLNAVELESGLKLPFEEMSINRIARLQGDKTGNTLKKILKGLDFPSYYAPEELLNKVKEHKEIALEAVTKRDYIYDNEKGIDPADLLQNMVKIQENCEKMTELAEKKKNDILPMLKRSSAIATDALKECLELEELSNSWWEQPAQFLVPWVKEDGLNLREWHTQWEVNSARLAQIQLLS